MPILSARKRQETVYQYLEIQMEVSCQNPPLIPPLVMGDFFRAQKNPKGDEMVKSCYQGRVTERVCEYSKIQSHEE